MAFRRLWRQSPGAAKNEQSTDNERPSVSFNVILIGNSGVGKTTFIKVITEGKSPLVIGSQMDPVTPTIGAEVTHVFERKYNILFGFNVWDLSGNHRYQSVTQSYYNKVDAAIWCVDKQAVTEMDVNAMKNTSELLALRAKASTMNRDAKITDETNRKIPLTWILFTKQDTMTHATTLNTDMSLADFATTIVEQRDVTAYNVEGMVNVFASIKTELIEEYARRTKIHENLTIRDNPPSLLIAPNDAASDALLGDEIFQKRESEHYHQCKCAP